jgi:hypothetical protein
MKKLILPFASLILFACSGDKAPAIDPKTSAPANTRAGEAAQEKGGHYEGVFTNGMKETYISFDVSPDGKEVRDLTFKGYWRCSGKLTQDIMGPEKAFPITGNKVDGIVVEPEGGGATATRYELHGSFEGSKAQGDFRMNINGLGCDTYKLTWTAERK